MFLWIMSDRVNEILLIYIFISIFMNILFLAETKRSNYKSMFTSNFFCSRILKSSCSSYVGMECAMVFMENHKRFGFSLKILKSFIEDLFQSFQKTNIFFQFSLWILCVSFLCKNWKKIATCLANRKPKSLNECVVKLFLSANELITIKQTWIMNVWSKGRNSDESPCR